MPPQLYKVSKASAILGVSKEALRKWDSEGRVKAIRIPGGMRLYDITQISETLVAGEKNKKGNRVILYARVSSSKQRDDLERQKQYLKDNLPDKYSGSEVVIVADIGSGLNFKRPGLLQVLGSVKERAVSGIVVASRDGLARFGVELIEWLCTQYNTEIVVLDHHDSTPEEELGTDLMSIVQVYCCRWNGKQRYAKKHNQDIQNQAQTDSRTEKKT